MHDGQAWDLLAKKLWLYYIICVHINQDYCKWYRYIMYNIHERDGQGSETCITCIYVCVVFKLKAPINRGREEMKSGGYGGRLVGIGCNNRQQ